MTKEFLAALDQIQYEKGIPKEEIVNLIEHAVQRALVKHYPLAARYKVEMNTETGAIKAWGIKMAVDKVTSPKDEILLSAAKAMGSKAKAGEDVELAVDINEIARIASETIEKVITQRIREYEKSSVFRKYKQLEHKIISGRVFRFIGRKAIVDLNDTEAVMPASQQIPKQFLRLNSHVRAYVMEVTGNERKNDVVLSRTHPGFLSALLAEEVPEVKDGIIEIVKVARSPGLRAKVLVKSNNPKIDPVGTCVGIRGGRIKQVMNELAGEKIDLINAALPVKKIIATALCPARIDVSRVTADEKAKKATVAVEPEQRARALGAEGVNVNLASQLLGWDIDVVTVSPEENAAESGSAGSENKEKDKEK